METHDHRHHRPEVKKITPMQDMLAIAEDVLGPRFDEDSKALWGIVEDHNSVTGLAVTDGSNYFVYERSISHKDTWGLKRVRFGKDGHVASISSQAIRSADEEYRFREQ